MTIIPLLKVLMGQEGLHGWVDRKSCAWRYGVDFYVPDATDITEKGNLEIGRYLLITDVEEDSLAKAAGLRAADRIVGVEGVAIEEKKEGVISAKLLKELGTSLDEEISVRVKRLNKDNELEDTTVVLKTPWGKSYVEGLEWCAAKRGKWAVELAVIDAMQWGVSYLPREKSESNKTRAVIFIILVMLMVTIVRCVAKFYQGYLAQKIVQTGVNRLREDAFGHVLAMPIGYFANERPSDTISRLIGDTAAMGKAIKIMLGKALREPLNAAFFMFFALWLNWQLTVIFFCGAPFVIGLVVVFGRKTKRASLKSLMASSQMLSKLQGTMSGLKVVKVYNQQENERIAFGRLNKKLLKQLLKISKIDAVTMPALEILGMAAGSAALVAGVHWVSRGELEAPEFLVLLVLLGTAAESVRKTSDIWNKIQQANAASERVFGIIDEPIEFEKAGAAELSPLREKIEFCDVSFSYPRSGRRVLKGVNLTVQAGHTVAIVGPNGSGKTTLVNLIPRFFDVDSGALLIDGVDVRSVTLRSLREQIGLVTQNVVTFNDTIAANIAYCRPTASDEEIIEAAKRSFSHEFIAPLPDGYETMIGEHGAGLSGGQLQRIVIARAILKNPSILIFDEATSQVDADSEAKIHKAIEEMMRERTSFIIAHRFSTVVNADVIVVMDKGRIIAQGQHNELIESCSLYQNLYRTQLIASK
jgi:ABC-type multidrug transport system fused ATPase/permease subunit